ncbi:MULTISPECIES: hypothetical protein [unclassified Burkholderia]|uniref:hypothetical protein n=1 Tax=unclassified Burkholderia TaxID=2613784 RepID=UPI000F5987E8|nr:MULTISPECIES: hypothetical protein [unclassified Burkholderia]
MNEDINPDFETPPVDLPELVAFAGSIAPGSQLIEIPCSSNPYPYGNCYWNAVYEAESIGGSVKHGWLYHYWPGQVIEAQHHAVVEHQDGTLIDATDKYPCVKDRARSVFLPDDSIPIDLRCPVYSIQTIPDHR